MDGDLALSFGFILAIVMLVLPFAYFINQRVPSTRNASWNWKRGRRKRIAS